MNLNDLKIAAERAINKINEFVDKNGSSNSITSIQNQMIFIRDNTGEGKHPADMLEGDTKFTYSIIA